MDDIDSAFLTFGMGRADAKAESHFCLESRLLLIDDEPRQLDSVRGLLNGRGYI